jgi:hypothetical protein
VKASILATVITVALGVAYCPCSALADATPAPSPSPRGVAVKGTLNLVYLTQGSSGPGLQPVEGPGFVQGAPAAPVTPYDLFSAAPMVPGNVQQDQLAIDALWRGRDASVGATLGIETLLGDRTNEAYWVEPLQPQDNPHLGSQATGYSVALPTHPGTDDFNGVRFGVNQVRIALAHDSLRIRGGWFDLAQALGCVFAPPVTTNALPALLLKTPESLNPDGSSLASWAPSPATLPMRGFDVLYKARSMDVEASDAELPSLPGTPARLESLSAGRFRDDGYGAMVQWIRVHSGGDPISTTTGFGFPTQTVPTDQGLFSVSTLYGQRETIAGGKLVVPVERFDATAEFSHSEYQMEGVGAARPVGGSWVHAALERRLNGVKLGVHYYRFEPTFATMVLPYGVPENVWSVSYSWPGPWLKSNFQLVDSTTLGVNREGPLYSFSSAGTRTKLLATYSDFRQIAPYTTANSHDPGFIDGFLLVQQNPAQATMGTFRRTSAFASEAFKFGTVDLDFVDDGLHRDAAASAPSDAVSYDAPQYVLSVTRNASARVAACAGIAYYGMHGSWADGPLTNVDFGMHVAFAGAQFAQTGRGATMISVRRSVLRGAPYFGRLGALKYGSPDFTATTLLVEQRYRL